MARSFPRSAAAVACAGTATLVAVAEPDFEGLGRILNFGGPGNVYSAPGNFLSRATDVSYRGDVIVGLSGDVHQDVGVFRWTRGSGMAALPFPADVGYFGFFYDYGSDWTGPFVSADGSTVAGTYEVKPNWDVLPYRWNVGSGFDRMTKAALYFGYSFYGARITGLSADGSVAIGALLGNYNLNGNQPFFWKSTEPYGEQASSVEVGEKSGYYYCTPAATFNAVSGDGTQAFGGGVQWLPPTYYYYCNWTTIASRTLLAPDDPEAIAPAWGISSDYFSVAKVASQDGNVVYGTTRVPYDSAVSMFRWTPGDGFIKIPIPTYYNSIDIYDVSADGSTVVGSLRSYYAPPVAFVWKDQWGFRRVSEVLESRGVSTEGWILTDAMGISGDGSTIVGQGYNPMNYTEAWRAVIYCIADFDHSDFVDVDDFPAFVHAFELGTIDADVDGSGFVDFDDFAYFVAAFEQGC